MGKLRFTFLFIFSVCLAFHQITIAQKDSSSKINITSDFVSRYIWRGLDYGKAPSIQPTFSYIKGDFEIGSWGAFNTTGCYHEVDIYVKYTIKGISAIFTDYFAHNEAQTNDTHYFNYSANITNHAFESALQYKGADKFPIRLLAAAYFYGNDRAWGYDAKKDSTLENYYSSYFEIGYAVKYKEKTFDLFIGLTPQAGAYGNTPGVVNAGITAYRTIAITDKFELPVKASLIANPQAGNLYFVLGITL